MGEEFNDLVCGADLVFEIEVIVFFFEKRKAFFDDFGEVLGEDVFCFSRVNWAGENGEARFCMGVDVFLNEGGDKLLVDAWGESHGCVKNRLAGKCIRITTEKRLGFLVHCRIKPRILYSDILILADVLIFHYANIKVT